MLLLARQVCLGTANTGIWLAEVWEVVHTWSLDGHAMLLLARQACCKRHQAQGAEFDLCLSMPCCACKQVSFIDAKALQGGMGFEEVWGLVHAWAANEQLSPL